MWTVFPNYYEGVLETAEQTKKNSAYRFGKYDIRVIIVCAWTIWTVYKTITLNSSVTVDDLTAIVSRSAAIELICFSTGIWFRDTTVLPQFPISDSPIAYYLSNKIAANNYFDGIILFGLLFVVNPIISIINLSIVFLGDLVKFFGLAQPWFFLLLACTSEDPFRGCALAIGGTYFYSGTTKLFNKLYYKDTAPHFFKPVTTILGIKEDSMIAYIMYACGVAVEALTGLSLLLGYGGLPAIAIHGYILTAVRTYHIINWNSLCLFISVASTFVTEPMPYSYSSIIIFIMYWLIPALPFVGQGLGYFSHHYFCGGYQGDCYLAISGGEYALQPQQVDIPLDCWKELVQKVPNPVLLTGEEAIGNRITSISPKENEPLLADLDQYYVWYWKWLCRDVLKNKGPSALVVTNFWIGYKYVNRLHIL